jgi:hypothetical protein
VLAIAALPVRAEMPEAVPVDGEPFDARPVAIDAQWQITFDGEGGQRVVPAADLVCWGCPAEVGRSPVLVLAGGGLVVGEVFAADKERLTADADLFGLIEVPLELLAGVVFHLPADRHARDRLLDRIAASTAESDRVILNNGDEVAGRLEGIQQGAMRLATAVGSVEVEIARTDALVFNPALLARPERQELHAIAGFRDGSRLVADRLVLSGQSLEIDVAGGLRWSAAAEELVCLQPLGGRVTYLSDVTADGYRHVPFLDLPWPYRTDRNVTGGWLRSGGRLYLKGLGMHSAARLTYLLGAKSRRFQAEVAIDDGTSGRGSLRFRVFLDGSPKYTSSTVRGGEPPVPVSVDVAGAERLDLLVDFADRADVGDHANWLNARLVR